MIALEVPPVAAFVPSSGPGGPAWPCAIHPPRSCGLLPRAAAPCWHSKKQSIPSRCNGRHRLKLSSSGNSDNRLNPTTGVLLDYINAIRPTTCTQAVGALIIGHLALTTRNIIPFSLQILTACISVYLSYGAGMVINDVVDIDNDSLHDVKSDRAIASGRISKKSGWTYSAILSAVSLGLAFALGREFCLWTLSNIAIVLGYAIGLQRIFLIKNLICGYLAISPLIGSALLASVGTASSVASTETISKLLRLAAVGFPMHVSREILKDIEDVNIDRGNKTTLPLVIGENLSHRIAYGIVGIVCSAMIFTPIYWNMFASNYPIYPLGVIIGLPMCFRASMLPLSEGQRLLKKSIYVLLASMIGGLLCK